MVKFMHVKYFPLVEEDTYQNNFHSVNTNRDVRGR